MSTPVGVNDGFVSNDSDSEIRETSAHASEQGAELVSHVRDFSYRKHQVVEREYSQLSGRTLDDPSAPEPRVPAYLANSTGRDWRNMIFCCLVDLKALLEFLWGSYLVGLAPPAVGMGTEKHVLFGARDPEVKISLPHLPPRCCLRER